MKQIILNLVVGTLSFIGTSCGAEFENGVSDIDSWKPASYDFTINHPCLVHTQADFDYVKNKVEQQAQPWLDGWNKLLESDGAQLTWIAKPQEEIVRTSNGGNFNTAAFDAAAAYQLALRWKISGDEDYAEASIDILNKWAKTCKGVNITTGQTDSHRLLAAGFIGYQFANPAEIMRDYPGWKKEDFEYFKKWITDVFYPICYQFLGDHFNSAPEDGWMSWDLPAMLTILSIGILCDDVDKINLALRYFYEGEGMGCIDNSVVAMHEDPAGKVEGKHLAQSQEMGRDQGHSTLNVPLHAYFCQTAYNIGIDLFSYKDNIVLDLCEYTAKYNVNPEETVDLPYTPYYSGKEGWHNVVAADGRGRARPGWELIYNHYVKIKGVKAPYSQEFAQKMRPEGGGHRGTAEADDLGFGTLMYTRD
jgi:hypothetical protein